MNLQRVKQIGSMFEGEDEFNFVIRSSESTEIQTHIHFDAKIDRNTEAEQIHSTMTLILSLNTKENGNNDNVK